MGRRFPLSHYAQDGATVSYNTDFAAAETDARQVNLTRFSLFFPEKRRFFLEDAGVFNFGGLGGRFRRRTGTRSSPVILPTSADVSG